MKTTQFRTETRSVQGRRWLLCVLLAAIVGATAISACGTNLHAASGRHLDRVTHLTLWLDWTPWGVHVPLFTAQKEGYFRKEGLDVSIRTPANVSDPLKLVGTLSDTLGIGYMSDVVSAEASGIPVVSLAALVQHHLNCIMTLRSSHITSPVQLVGKRVGQGGTPADQVILNTVFRHAGVEGKVHLVNLNYPYVPALLDGRVDAIEGAYQVWEKIQIEQQGRRVNVIQLQKWGVPDEYELVLLASRHMTEAHPGVLRRFMRALDMGESLAVRHPQRAVSDFLALNPQTSAGKRLVRQSWHLLIPFVQKRGVAFGSQTSGRWHGLAAWMYRNHLVNRLVPNSQLFTNRFQVQG